MINILTLYYLHRGADDYKDLLSVRLLDPARRAIETLEDSMRGVLLDRLYFYPEDAALPRSKYAREHDWHEFERVEISALWKSEQFTPHIWDFDDFLGDLRASKARRSPAPVLSLPRIHTKPRLIPMRTYISVLEMRRKWRSTRSILGAIHDPEMKVLVLPKEDWELLSYSLAVDVESFGGMVADDITRALAHVWEW